MPKYMVQGALSGAGLTGVIKDGGSRRNLVLKQAVESMGGTLEAFYYAFGRNDFVLIIDMPSNVSAAGLMLAVGAAGGASELATTPLLTAAEIDEAVTSHPDYTPPGDSGTSGR